MKVGIYYEEKEPALGGAYTLEMQLLNAFARHSLNQGHTFVLLSECDLNTSCPATLKGFDKYQIKVPFYQKISLLTVAIAGRLLSFFGISLLNSVHQSLKYKAIERQVLKSSVDFIISFNQNVVTKEIPYFVTLWDLEHRTKPFFPEVSSHGIWKNRESKFIEVLARAAAIATGTEVGKVQIERFYNVPEGVVSVLPFPEPEFADLHLDCSSILAKYGLPDKFLLYPAQFWPHKNHIGLIKALHILSRDKGLAINLVFVGSDKGNQRHVESLVKDLGLAEQVFFLGFVSREELAVLYQKAFALTYVTYFGPDNVPPLEAFTLGCPVIASQVSGASEQLQDAALLVNPKDPQEIAAAILELLESPSLRDELISKGRILASKFKSQDYVEKVISILDGFEAYRSCWPSGNKSSKVRW